MATTVTLKPNAIDLSGSTSGTTTLQATAVAGTTTITLPAATDTLVGKATTDTLTNKTLTTPVISTISNTGTLTLPTSTDTLVGRATTDTLTNKTLTTPVISSLSSASATALTLQSSGTTAITVDASQNVGIGTTSPTGKLNVVTNNTHAGGATFDSTGTTQIWMRDTDATTNTRNWGFQISGGDLNILRANDDRASGFVTPVSFAQAPANSLNIDSSGRFCINNTATIDGSRLSVQMNTSDNAVSIRSFDSSTSVMMMQFYTLANTRIGFIQTVTGSSTTYSTSSDYRLKESIAPMTGALAKVAALKPVTYKWKSNGLNSQGFIAHELAEIVPECVTGEKDAVNAEGNPEYQGIDTSFLVATLTAAIQEQQALITAQAETINALTARIVALEAK